jgi:hypothetical protein
MSLRSLSNHQCFRRKFNGTQPSIGCALFVSSLPPLIGFLSLPCYNNLLIIVNAPLLLPLALHCQAHISFVQSLLQVLPIRLELCRVILKNRFNMFLQLQQESLGLGRRPVGFTGIIIQNGMTALGKLRFSFDLY